MDKLNFIDNCICECCGHPIEEYSYRLCSHCHNEKRYFEHAFIPLEYDDFSKTAVIMFKHHYHPFYAKALAFLIADKILSSPFYAKFDYITFVPESRKAERKRGYNHAKLIAKEISKMLNIPLTDTLIRTDSGEKQATLNREERRKNVRKCYFKGSSTFDGGNVLLIDDVYTTGETSNYCSKLLREIGFEKVYVGACMMRI